MDAKTKRYLELMIQQEKIQQEIDELGGTLIKLYKFTGYFADINDNYIGYCDSDISKHIIESAIRNETNGLCNIYDIKSTNIIWNDDINLNYTTCTKNDYEEYFI